MKQFFSFILLLCLWGNAASALEAGVLVGAQSTGIEGAPAGVSYSRKTGTQYGGIFSIDIFPLIDLRTGVIFKTREIDGVLTATSTEFTTKDKVMDIPLLLQVNLIMDLYALGGATYSSVQETTCSSRTANVTYTCTAKTPDDLSMSLGVGYRLINLGLISLNLEAQYDHGTKNQSTGSDTLYNRGYALNAALMVGF